MQTEFVISAGEQPKRLDVFLVHREPKLSRAALQRMITAGWVRVNSLIAKSSQRIKAGDVIVFDAPQAAPLRIDGETKQLEILFEDHACLVLNKPAGIVVHPSPGHWSNTLLNALLDHCARGGGSATPGVVHRLDKDTSGVMVVAKTEEAHRKLSMQFERHAITRHYEALVVGVPPESEGRIDAALGPDRRNPKRSSVQTLHPRPAVTDYRVEEMFGKAAARLVLSPHTGRTHQLRAHLHTIGHAILGDRAYGGERVGAIAGYEIPRVMLHARTLGFTHPVTGMYGEWTADAPSDFQAVRQGLYAGRQFEPAGDERLQREA
ncbi:MAG: RluA family pseudouridine synthase [Nitrospira sp.]|nr:RluA family pseudouridine synthase [Nitrospira sp.]